MTEEDRVLKRCRTKGCPHRTYDRYCELCAKNTTVEKERYRRYDSYERDIDAAKFYKSRSWTIQATSQKTKYPYCQWQMPSGLPCMSTHKLQCDHITPRKQGGRDHPSNYQTLCDTHHGYKTAMEANSFFGRTQVTVVCGAPGSGKSTYVRQRLTIGCVVYDLDSIVNALTNSSIHYQPPTVMDIAWSIRDHLLVTIPTIKGCPHIYWIESGSSKERRCILRDRLHADVVVIESTSEQCKHNALIDANRDHSMDWNALIDAWFKSYERCSLDVIV